jgi:hypothetical protein
MKIEKNILTAALVLAATSTAMASEEKYPAYEFQPSVIYSNPELIAKTSGATAGASGAMASAAAPTAEFDPKYPAAYFVPSVIYPAK